MEIVISVISVEAVSKYWGAVGSAAIKNQLRRLCRRFGKNNCCRIRISLIW